MLNRLSTKDLLVWRHILPTSYDICSTDCGSAEDIDHLFITFKVFGNLWLAIFGWLGVSTTFHGNIQDHLMQYGGLGTE
uniref:Uncharacterized protein n=1 Tax=Medicago truncatula TaxID=3880 RepID=A2Q221_MEDTR|nr:hypothetical protein MtrDRAFT_AC149206g28v2 [Medicago truncatula]